MEKLLRLCKKKETSFFVLPSTFRNFADMKKAIVMGASSGMGYEVAKILLKDGWQIGVAARRVDKLSELAKEFPEQVLTEGIDVTDEDAPRKLLRGRTVFPCFGNREAKP